MYRYLIENMKQWLSAPNRKPLVLRGARQTGKTWAARELARCTGKTLIELNLERQTNLATHFECNDPKTILLNLQSALNTTIDPNTAILFLDEIQATPTLLAKLRWFYEALPELPIITAGSLLEPLLEQHQFSMPVGRIQYLYVEPLSFNEFLLASDESHLLTAIKNTTFNAPLNAALHDKANQHFKEYLMVGGMPEAVATWVNTRSLDQLSMVHHNLLGTYIDDFSKYAGKISDTYLRETLNTIPRTLTRKFIYSHVSKTARQSTIKQAVQLLTQARLCHLVQGVSANGIPAGAEANPKQYKLILLDVGLASTLLGLQLFQFQSLDDVMLINKGALTEQVAGQLLRLLSPSYAEPKLHYWARETPSSTAEIDYLLQDNQQLIPIEIKSGSEGKLRSLHQFMSEKSWETAVRFYAGNLHQSMINTKTNAGKTVSYQLLSVPLYLISETHRLLGLAQDKHTK